MGEGSKGGVMVRIIKPNFFVALIVSLGIAVVVLAVMVMECLR